MLLLDCGAVGARLFLTSNTEPIDGEEIGDDLADDWTEAFDLALDGKYAPRCTEADLMSSTNLLPIWGGSGNASNAVLSVCWLTLLLVELTSESNGETSASENADLDGQG